MLNIFQISSNDQSIYYLLQVFGPVGDVLTLPIAGSVSTNLIFGVMFQIFNTIALTAGALIIVYTTVVGLLMTAQEGEFLKKWHGIWVPIRMVLGTAALFPGASGYSIIQIIVMWLVVQGVGAADTLWTGVLNYAQSAGSPFSGIDIPGGTLDIKQQVTYMFQNSVCQETKRAKYRVSDSTYAWYCADPKNALTTYICRASDGDVYNAIDGPQTKEVQETGKNPSTKVYYTFGNVPQKTGAPSGDCGVMKYADPNATDANFHPCQTDPNRTDWGPNSLYCLSYKGVQQAVQSIMPVFGAIAKQYALIDYQYVQFYTTPVIPPSPEALGLREPTFSGGSFRTYIRELARFRLLKNIPNTGTKDMRYTVEPPQWIKDYCTQGLGITDPNKCCVNPSSWCDNASDFPYPYETSQASSKQDTSYSTQKTKNVAINPYLDYALEPYLGPNLDFIEAATNQIVQQGVTGPYTAYIASLGPSNLKNQYKKMQEDGWLNAGSYYFQLVRKSNAEVVAKQPTLAVTVNTTEGVTGYRNSQNAAGALVDAIDSSIDESGLGAMSPGLSKAATGVNYMVTGFIYMLNNSGSSPLVSISTFGFIMMVLAISLFVFVTLFTAYWSLGLGFANFVALGTGFTMNPLGEMKKALWGMFEPIIILFLVAMFTIGALLGIYLPLIPFLVFTVTAIGWFIGVIEAMVASPIIALGILSPGGQHEIMGKAEASVMILFNLFLRPSLIIFGFVAASVLLVPIIKFFNEGFLRTVEAFMPTADLIVSLVLMSVYTTLILTVTSKVFTLVHMVPERILTYLGVSPISYGEGEALGAAKEAVSGAAAGTAGAGKESGKSAQALGEAGAKYKADQKAKDEKNQAKGKAVDDKAEAKEQKGGGGAPGE